MRPARSTPVLAALFVALASAALGLLTTPAQTCQKPPHMARMISHAKRLLDYFGHAFQRPELRGVSGGGRTALEQRPQSPPLRGRKSRRASRRRARAEPGSAFSLVGLIPAVHRTHRSTYGTRRRRKILARFEQSHSSSAPPLQLPRAPWWSHAPYYNKSEWLFPLLIRMSIVPNQAHWSCGLTMSAVLSVVCV